MSDRYRTGCVAVAALCLVVYALGCRPSSSSQSQGTAPAAGAPQAGAAPQGAAQTEEPRCSVSCSPDKPRTVVAEISWPMPQRAASRQALTEGVAQQTLDVTTFKDGFSSGAFAQLSSVRENARFASRAAQPDPTAASLQALSVTRVRTLQDRIASGASRSATELMSPTANDDASRVVVIEIEGLEPGLNYYWRRTAGGPVVRCQAPVCPFDSRGGR